MTKQILVGILLGALSAISTAQAKPPKVIVLDTIVIVVDVPVKKKYVKKDPVKCHMEGRIRVCRPEKIAADRNTRITSDLSRPGKIILNPRRWFHLRRK